MTEREKWGDTWICPECGNEMFQTDTTFSDINTSRCKAGEKTGDIYSCETCEENYLDNYLTKKLEVWHG